MKKELIDWFLYESTAHIDGYTVIHGQLFCNHGSGLGGADRTYWSIKIGRKGSDRPQIHVGAWSYILKIWRAEQARLEKSLKHTLAYHDGQGSFQCGGTFRPRKERKK